MNFGQQVLFENVSFQLNQGHRYGLVGANGSGKSTLLKILSGDIQAETGEFNYPASLKMGVLKQDQFIFEDLSIIDVVLKGKPALWNALQQRSKLAKEKTVTDEIGKSLADLEMKIADLGGYQAEADASELLTGLGIPSTRQNDKLNTLSGGYKLRVLLAQCLFSEPDFLLLDEPTNHLDLSSIQWLEGYLSQFSGTCMVISHDQYFLNRICTHMVDIDYGTIKIYTGNYEAFKDAKILEKNQKEAEIVRQEKRKEELQQFIDRFKAKATKARQANSKAKQLDRMEDIVIKRSSRISPGFKFNIQRPSGKIALTVKHVSKSFNNLQVIKDISFTMERGEKIAVIGANGIGKSTLLKILAGVHEPTSGNVEMGYEIASEYCPQDHSEMIPAGTTPFEWLYSFAPGETIGTIRGLLGRVLLKGDDADKSTESLSGGESARLIFAKIMLLNPNLLLLDEPTNHMDIESLEALSQALKSYEGSIVCVSHDRRFIETFATMILELKTDGFELFKGTYWEYLEKQGIDYLDRSISQLSAKTNTIKKQNSADSKEWRRRAKEIGKLEKAVKKKEEEISTLESEISQSEQILSDGQLYEPENRAKLEQEIQKKEYLDKKLHDTINKWEDLQNQLDELSILTKTKT